MNITILTGCCLSLLPTLPDQSVHCCITSPPYFHLRDYQAAGQIGLEETPEAYLDQLVRVFREVRRLLRDNGTLWVNIADSYLNKQLLGIPWRLALALQADGWVLRQELIWHRTNALPESVTDRCTKSHETIFLLSKNKNYYFDQDAIREPMVKGAAGSDFHTGKTGDHQLGRSSEKPREDNPKGRNKRSVWSIPTKPSAHEHLACYPPELIEPCILAGSPHGGTVLDPFFGAGTTGLVADRHGRHCLGIELNPEYVQIAEKRLRRDAGMFADIVVAA